MSPLPGDQAGWRTAERGTRKAKAAVPGRGLRARPPIAPIAPHFARLPTSRCRGRPRSAPRACRRRAGAEAGAGVRVKEGGSWWAGRSRREEEAAGVGEEEAPRPAAGRHLRHRLCLAAQSGRAATGGPLLLPQPQSQDWPPAPADLSTRAGFSGFVFASCLYPPLPSLDGDGRWRWARGALKFALVPRGPWRAWSAAEQVTPASGALGNF